MAELKLQKHLAGFTQATIETKLFNQEIGSNEALRHLVYKHRDNKIDIFPSEEKLGNTSPGTSGAAIIGVNAASFSTLGSMDEQALWAEVDTQITNILGDITAIGDGLTTVLGNYVVDDGSKGPQTIINNIIVSGDLTADRVGAGKTPVNLLDVDGGSDGTDIALINSTHNNTAAFNAVLITKNSNASSATAGRVVHQLQVQRLGGGSPVGGIGLQLTGPDQGFFFIPVPGSTLNNTGLTLDHNGLLSAPGDLDLNTNDLLAVSNIVGGDGANDGITMVVGNSGLLRLNATDDGTIQADIGNGSSDGLFEVVSQGKNLIHANGEGGGGLQHVDLGSSDATSHVGVSGRFAIDNLAANITASVTQTQGQQLLTKVINEVGTVANANDVVTLPPNSVYTFGPTGILVVIKNNGANTLQVFPNTGDSIDNGGTNASITIAAGAGLEFWNNSGQWITV